MYHISDVYYKYLVKTQSTDLGRTNLYYGSTVLSLLKTFLPSRNMNLYYDPNVRILHDKPRRRRRLSSLAVILLAVVVVVVVVTNHRINGGAHRPEHACARTTPHRFSSEARLLRVAPSG